MNINKVTVGGRLTRDPELKALPSGMQVVSFSVAASYSKKNKDTGQYEQVPEYINCIAFGKSAETIARYFHKGSQIVCFGRLQTRNWEKDGQKQYRTEVILEPVGGFEFVDKKTDSQSAPATTAAPSYASQVPDYPEEEINPDDIPF